MNWKYDHPTWFHQMLSGSAGYVYKKRNIFLTFPLSPSSTWTLQSHWEMSRFSCPLTTELSFHFSTHDVCIGLTKSPPMKWINLFFGRSKSAQDWLELDYFLTMLKPPTTKYKLFLLSFQICTLLTWTWPL